MHATFSFVCLVALVRLNGWFGRTAPPQPAVRGRRHAYDSAARHDSADFAAVLALTALVGPVVEAVVRVALVAK